MLKAKGVTTLIVSGTASNGAALYTAYEAVARGYTVAVPVDLISANNPFADFYTEWQLLNLPGPSNPQNTALKDKAVTLTRSGHD